MASKFFVLPGWARRNPVINLGLQPSHLTADFAASRKCPSAHPLPNGDVGHADAVEYFWFKYEARRRRWLAYNFLLREAGYCAVPRGRCLFLVGYVRLSIEYARRNAKLRPALVKRSSDDLALRGLRWAKPRGSVSAASRCPICRWAVWGCQPYAVDQRPLFAELSDEALTSGMAVPKFAPTINVKHFSTPATAKPFFQQFCQIEGRCRPLELPTNNMMRDATASIMRLFSSAYWWRS